jgi:hypothetical protein
MAMVPLAFPEERIQEPVTGLGLSNTPLRVAVCIWPAALPQGVANGMKGAAPPNVLIVLHPVGL